MFKIFIFFAFVCLSYCTNSELKPSTSYYSNSNIMSAQENSNIDFQKLILGEWTGEVNGNKNEVIKVILIFKENNVCEYSESVFVLNEKKSETKNKCSYHFKDFRTLKIPGFFDNLIINRKTDDEIFFTPNEDLKEDLEIIYLCHFKKAK